MSVTRIIGVDFGTSTSVIRVKRYENEKPLGEKFDSKPVVFNMGSTMVPTLIRKSGEDTVYGFNAEVAKRSSMLYQNFKVFLESDSTDQKEKARELTADFLRYLAKVYCEQSVGGHFGDPSDEEKTIISYPVKWSEETKRFMVEAAKDAGFPNVSGMDEANAAISAVTLQNEELLKSMGYLRKNEPLNILLLDMGAGTTDLVLCRYTPERENCCEILCTYPDKGNVLFGGREVDELLGKYIIDIVPSKFKSKVLKRIGQEKYKAWKEKTVSPYLHKSELVEEFSALDNLADDINSLAGTQEFDVEFRLGRTDFENLLNNYLQELPTLIKGCLKEAKLTGDVIDLVVLTGGHSQWYFVKDILLGNNQSHGVCGLKKLEADEKRFVTLPRPQETVALGLVFSEMSIKAEPKNVKETNQNFLLKIDYVYTISSGDSIVSGIIRQGSIKVGDDVEIVLSSNNRMKASIMSMNLHNDSSRTTRKIVNTAQKGDYVSMHLTYGANGENDNVELGQFICTPGLITKDIGNVTQKEPTTDDSNNLQEQFEACWKRLKQDMTKATKLNSGTFGLHTVNSISIDKVKELIALLSDRGYSIDIKDVLLFYYSKLSTLSVKIWSDEIVCDPRFLLTDKALYVFRTKASKSIFATNFLLI